MLAIFSMEVLTVLVCFCINSLCIKSEDDELPIYNLNHSDLNTPGANKIVIPFDEES